MQDYFVSDFSGGISTIRDQRLILTEMVNYFTSREDQNGPLEWLSKERGIPLEVLKEHDVFFIDDDTMASDIPEEYRNENLGICRYVYVVYEGRIVYPVKSPEGLVMGFCGWTLDEGVVKYLDSKNFGYKAKFNTMFGMEKLLDYYKSSNIVVLVEGIVDCLWLRSIGVNAFALLGSMLTSYVTTILLRFKDRLVVIPDNDNFKGVAEDRTAGEGFVKSALYLLPEARVFQTTSAKDLDDVIRNTGRKELLTEELLNLNNIFYDFVELRQRVKQKWRGFKNEKNKY